jgi:DNA-binding PadR family transcriptional regulator
MLAAEPMTGYGLRKAIAGSVGHFWHESYGQLYPTLRRLAGEGLVSARATRGGPGRGGAVYHVTQAGRAALAAWLALPPVLEPARNEVLLKVFFAGAVPSEVTARNLEGVAEAVRQQRSQLEAIAAQMDAAPALHRDAPYWRLTLEYGLESTRSALGWLEHAQAVLRAPPGGASGRPPAATPRRSAAPRHRRGSA